VDGAGAWDRFRHVTLPLLKPALLPAVILGSVWTFNMFNIIYLVSGGAPAGANEILITKAYKIAFEEYRYAYSAAYSTVIFLILLGADVLNVFLALTQMNTELAKWVIGLQLPPLLVMAVIILIYLMLGCIMDSLSMILLTIPVFYPVVMGLDFGGMGAEPKAIWFGIIVLMVVEIGLITPPVGMNVFVINSLARDVPMKETFKFVMPFLVSDLLRIIAIVLFPGLVLFVFDLPWG
jgi:TRAP-type C4-dicarboxylate transport system permease large subunit